MTLLMWPLTSEMRWKVTLFFQMCVLSCSVSGKENHNQGMVPIEILSLPFFLATNPCDYNYPKGRSIEILHFFKFCTMSWVLPCCLAYAETSHPPLSLPLPSSSSSSPDAATLLELPFYTPHSLILWESLKGQDSLVLSCNCSFFKQA